MFCTDKNWHLEMILEQIQEIRAEREHLRELLKRYNIKICNNWKDINYKYIPITIIEARRDNTESFNEIYQALYKSHCTELKRTKSGGVCKNLEERWKPFKYDVSFKGTVVEITFVSVYGSCRIQWRLVPKAGDDEHKFTTASKYFKNYFLPTCKKFGINLKDYEISKEDGLKAKEEIHFIDRRVIDTAASYQAVYENNINHVDFHKFYISGLLHSHPEFEPVVSYLAAKNGPDNFHKTGLASIIGYFQSQYCGYKFAKLTKDAMNDAYSRFDKVLEKLSKERRVLATTTDGIWYQGDIYHGEFEGTGLTEWENDITDCKKIRFKGPNCYEYIDSEGNYKPVVSGLTRADRVLDRSKWKWGFILSTDFETWTFKEGRGILWAN